MNGNQFLTKAHTIASIALYVTELVVSGGAGTFSILAGTEEERMDSDAGSFAVWWQGTVGIVIWCLLSPCDVGDGLEVAVEGARGEGEGPRVVSSTTAEVLTESQLRQFLAAQDQRRGGTQDWGPVPTCLSPFQTRGRGADLGGVPARAPIQFQKGGGTCQC